MKLNARQVVATADNHPGTITESKITYAEILGITETYRMYRKRDKNVRYLYTVNQHLVGARLVSIGEKDEESITSENVEINSPK